MTIAGLSSTLLTQNPQVIFFAPLASGFTTKGTAALTPFDTGQDCYDIDNGVSGAPLSIINGVLTNTASAVGVAAGYIQANIGRNVSRIGGGFSFKPGSGGNQGSAVFVIWNSILTSASTIPNSGFHIAITRTNWSLGSFQSGAFASYAGATFTTPLSPNTNYTFDAQISGSTVTMTLPDGSVVPVTNALISSLAGTYPCYEVFQNDASSDDKAGFTNIYAS